MIAGFNTDVDYAGTVYHVQTEDKGAPHHVIMSLVYDKGTILASKREAYDTTTPETELTERVNKQHKLICAAVKLGRVEDLKRMTASARTAAKKSKVPVAESVTVIDTVAKPPAMDVPQSLNDDLLTIDLPPEQLSHDLEPSEKVELQLIDPFADLPIIEIDDIEIIEEYEEIVADAVEVVSELSGQSRPLHNRLGVELLGDRRFHAGDRTTVDIMISRGSDRKVIANAQIMIKILGSAFRPVIFHARSDQNGLARVHLQVPQFNAGRAALLVRAIADGEEVELRRLVTADS